MEVFSDREVGGPLILNTISSFLTLDELLDCMVKHLVGHFHIFEQELLNFRQTQQHRRLKVLSALFLFCLNKILHEFVKVRARNRKLLLYVLFKVSFSRWSRVKARSH